MISLNQFNRKELKKLYIKIHTKLCEHEQGIIELEPKEIELCNEVIKETRKKLVEYDFNQLLNKERK